MPPICPVYLRYISHQVGIDRFRPNLVLRGCSPLEEDRWWEIYGRYAGDIVEINCSPLEEDRWCGLTT